MIVYKITNLINGKVYIGVTIRDIETRFKEHCNKKTNTGGKSLIRRAIKKYGKENFIIEQVDSANSVDELYKKEFYLIDELNSLTPNGYNLIRGGSGCKSFKQTKEHIERLIKRNKENPPALGYKYPEKAREKMAKIRTKIGPFKNSKSGYKGVSKKGEYWTAQIQHKGVVHNLGTFLTTFDAAIAYDNKARELLGVGCYLNFPELNLPTPSVQKPPKKASAESIKKRSEAIVNKPPRNGKRYKNIQQRKNRYTVNIKRDGKFVDGSYYEFEVEAAIAADRIMFDLYGKNCYLNFGGQFV